MFRILFCYIIYYPPYGVYGILMSYILMFCILCCYIIYYPPYGVYGMVILVYLCFTYLTATLCIMQDLHVAAIKLTWKCTLVNFDKWMYQKEQMYITLGKPIMMFSNSQFN